MSVIPEGFGEATLNFTGGPSDPINIVWGYEVATLTSEPNENAQNCYEAFALGQNPWTKLSGPLTLQSCTVRETEGGVVRNGEYVAPVASGNPANPMLPTNNALLVRKVSSAGGRRGTGRMYVPGLNETAVDAQGIVESSYLIVLQAAFTGMLGDLSTNDVPMHILHDIAGPAPTLVQSLAVQARVATQRRRLR